MPNTVLLDWPEESASDVRVQDFVAWKSGGVEDFFFFFGGGRELALDC